MSEPRNTPSYSATNAVGGRIILQFCEWRNGQAYMVTDGCAAYLVDPQTGICEGIESVRGVVLTLVPNALRRLRRAYEER